jgi:hypothetical protein
VFTGGTGGIDSWLTSDHADTVIVRLNQLAVEPLSCGQLNQLLALSHQPEVSSGFFRYYWLSEPRHPYDTTRLPQHHATYKSVDQILSIDQLCWGLHRIYIDSLLCFGSIRDGYRALRGLNYDELKDFFEKQRFDSDALLHRGPVLQSVRQELRREVVPAHASELTQRAGVLPVREP